MDIKKDYSDLFDEIINDNFTEELLEMASIPPVNRHDLPGVLIAVNPDSNRTGDCYFKFYNAESYSKATTVWRIKFTKPEFIKEHKRKISSSITMTTKYKKLLIKYLISPSGFDDSFTVWDETKMFWNREHQLIPSCSLADYMSGKFDRQNQNNPSYIPSSLKQPDYNQLP